MKYYKISIIIPTLNQGLFIEECIRSLVQQNYPNLELIIIDGGSTDNTLEIIKKYEKYITCWISEKDSGQSHAINKGLELANGHIINWLNSDDQLASNALFKINELFQNYKPDILAAATLLVYQNSQKQKKILPEQKDYIFQIPVRMPFPQPSLFYSSKLLQNFRVNEQLHFAMDMELLTRIFFSNENVNIHISNQILSIYLVHNTSKTHTQPLKFFEEWAEVFYQFCQSIEFYTALSIIQDLNIFHPSILTKNFTIPTSVKNKFKFHEKDFMAYFLKYRLFYHIESHSFNDAYKILNYFRTNLSGYFYRWNMWRYYLSIFKRQTI